MSIEKLKEELRKFVEFDEKAAEEHGLKEFYFYRSHPKEYQAMARWQHAKSARYAEHLLEAIEVLEKYANGNALRVKPEKAHLYDKDYPTDSIQWRQRSMSDYDDRILAKEILAKLSKGDGA